MLSSLPKPGKVELLLLGKAYNALVEVKIARYMDSCLDAAVFASQWSPVNKADFILSTRLFAALYLALLLSCLLRAEFYSKKRAP